MKRRNFIKLSATASVLGLTPIEIQAALKPLMPLLECPDISKRKIVLINLAGGNDGINTTVPLNQYDIYSNLRPTLRIPETGLKSYIKLDSNLADNQQIGLNPALVDFKSLYDDGWMRVLQGVGYPSQNKSHFKSTDLYMTGNDGNSMQNGFDSGWIGRFMEKYYMEQLAEEYPLAVQIGSNKTSLGFHGTFEHGMAINITGQDPAGFYSVLSGLGGVPPTNIPNTDYGTELEFIKNTDALSNQYAQSISGAFNIGSNGITYPQSDIANQLKTVARLISGDLGTKVYMVRISGFDTHNAQVQEAGDPLGRHHELLTYLSEAVGAFFKDLDSQSLTDDVIAVTFSEFGRKAKENGNLGTDHGEIAPMFVFGKPIEGGVTGINPDLSEAIKDNNYQIKTVQFDYRQTLGTLLQDYLGADTPIIDSAFFNHTLQDTFANQKIPELVKEEYTISEACITGIEEPIPPIEGYQWQVFPNPFSSELHLSGIEDHDSVSLYIYTTTGSLIYKNEVSAENNRIRLELGHLSSGIYMLQIDSGAETETHKIVKK